MKHGLDPGLEVLRALAEQPRDDLHDGRGCGRRDEEEQGQTDGRLECL
jgi:hypothetical protein